MPDLDSPALGLRTGIDVVSVERLARLLSRHERAAKRLFTDGELAYCRGRRRADEHLAARFAAKEAVFKLLGGGLGQGLGFRDVEVVNMPSGGPAVVLHGRAAYLATREGIGSVEISLSHDAGVAVAQAVAWLLLRSAEHECDDIADSVDAE